MNVEVRFVVSAVIPLVVCLKDFELLQKIFTASRLLIITAPLFNYVYNLVWL